MDIKQIWSASLSYIQKEVNSVVGFNTYIKDITPISYDGETFIAGVSNMICKSMIEIRYINSIEKAISKITAKPVNVIIVLKDEYKKEEEPKKEVKKENSNNVIIKCIS